VIRPVQRRRLRKDHFRLVYNWIFLLLLKLVRKNTHQICDNEGLYVCIRLWRIFAGQHLL
jgi:hypothetical protein